MNQIKSTIFSVLLSITMLFSMAQDNTLTPKKNKTTTTTTESTTQIFNRVMVIPYDARMYMSGIDKDIAKKTGLSYYQIKKRMRIGLTHIVSITADNTFPSSVLLLPFDSSGYQIAEDLQYTYSSIGYKYEALPLDSAVTEPKQNTLQKTVKNIGSVFNNNSDNTLKQGNETGIVNGEVVVPVDNTLRYMNTIIINPNLLPYLNTTYKCDIFLFINELDIEEAAPQSNYGLDEKAYLRKIKVHYSIITADGNLIYGGAAVVYMDTKTNDLNSIINHYFSAISKKICSHLPVPTLDKAHQQKKEEEEKKAKEQESRIQNN